MELPKLKQEWINYAKESGYDTAIAFEHNNFDKPYDYCGNVETAVTMANEGLLIVALPDAKSGAAYNNMPLQEALDYERDLVIDCFGESYLK